MNKVLLISMPFGALERQALGLSLLKAGLTQQGVPCDVRYLTFPFAEFIGYEEYQWLTFEVPYTAFAGDWTFTQALYGEHPVDEERYIQDVLRQRWQLDETSIGRILRIRSLVLPFLTYCLAYIQWEEYDIVGFTSTFEQNIASLALAQRIKAAHPGIAIVFGGANWEGEMGHELHTQFPFVDYVCSGEADESFPALVQRVLAHQPVDSPESIPGIIYRAGGQSIYTGQANLMRTMDQLPIPDFSDYFRDLGQSTVGALVVPILLLETARGCWWGAKSHCTFCGLNGGTMAFRSKSPPRALAELAHLVDRWGIDFVEVVDNILDMKYFTTVLPALARASRTVHLFYEVKANLNRKQLQILAAAGVYHIQPGIESLNDHILQLMRKGTTALRNIQLMKWCREYNISADWNILYGFPGETEEDYAGLLELLQAIRFFKPPTGCGPIRLDRFSPYFNDPTAFGFTNVRPLAPYRFLYPFADAILHRIAYYFEYDYAPGINLPAKVREVVEYVQAWQRAPEYGVLYAMSQPDGSLILIDTRSEAVQPQFILSGLTQAIYQYCDEYHTCAAVRHYLQNAFPDIVISVEQVRGLLDGLVANRLMVKDKDHYLSLAIAVQPVRAMSERATPLAAAPNGNGAAQLGSSYLLPAVELLAT